MLKAKHEGQHSCSCLLSPFLETRSLSAHTHAHICAASAAALSALCSYLLHVLASVIIWCWDCPLPVLLMRWQWYWLLNASNSFHLWWQQRACQDSKGENAEKELELWGWQISSSSVTVSLLAALMESTWVKSWKNCFLCDSVGMELSRGSKRIKRHTYQEFSF